MGRDTRRTMTHPTLRFVCFTEHLHLLETSPFSFSRIRTLMMFRANRPIKEADMTSRSWCASSAMVNLGYTSRITGVSFIMSLKFLDKLGLHFDTRRDNGFD